MQNQIRIAISEITKDIKEKIEYVEEKFIREKSDVNINEIINQYTLTNIMKKFFTSNQLSQIMEETNPLAEITHKRKVSSFGIGAIDRKKAKIKVREIHPSHYGRICPIETTEGKNAGLILSLAKDIRLNKYGFIESPFYQVIKRKVLINKGIFYISSEQEKNFKLAPGDLYTTSKNIIFNKEKYYGIRKNHLFITDKPKNINFISSSTNQFISIGTGLIPFIEHNDANRALMGSNMQRQALPLEKGETSLIETGIEKLIAKESQSTIIAKESGKVKYSNTKKIIIEKKILKIKELYNKSALRKIKNSIREKYQSKIIRAKTNTYFLENSRKSNQNSYLTQKPTVNKNEWVRKGQIIADGAGSLNGKLSLGKNILIGYIGWEGYNFEDAIIINERLVNDDIFTSIHIKKYKTFILSDEKGEVRTKN